MEILEEFNNLKEVALHHGALSRYTASISELETYQKFEKL